MTNNTPLRANATPTRCARAMRSFSRRRLTAVMATGVTAYSSAMLVALVVWPAW